MNSIAKQAIKNLICDDPEIDYRITTGIEENRKGWAHVEVVYDNGEAVKNADISYRMVKHEYRFGCNAFMLDGFTDQEKNIELKDITFEESE